MTQPLAALLVLAMFVGCAGMSSWTGREAVRAFRKWKSGRSQPLISPDPTLAEKVPPHWPLNPVRWPEPFVDGKRILSRDLCALYAHEAWRKHNRVRAGSGLALVTGGAWLGTTLPKTIKTMFSGDDGFVFGVIPAAMVDLQWWGVVAPLAVVWLGLALQSDAEGIALVRAAYAEASTRDEAESGNLPGEKDRPDQRPQSFRAFIWERLRSRRRASQETNARTD